MYAGCFVVEGEAVAIVVATGAHTRLAKIAHLSLMEHRPSTPLRRELERVSKIIAITAVVVGFAAFGLALLLGTPASDGFLFAIGVTVALVPEGLLPTVTISLALGAQHMAARHALVRHLESVETLGSTTFICTDKTGTLTRNEMTVVEVWLPEGVAVIDGPGYGPEASIECRPPSARASLVRLATVATRCGSGRAIEREGAWIAHGDPMEAALDTLARRCGVETPLDDPRSIRRFPFDPRRRRMSIVADGEVMVKGAPDSVLDRCIDPIGAAGAMEVMTRRGLRVLAIARRAAEGPLDEAEAVEDRLELLGLVALEDPPRRGAAAAISACRRAGISIAMVTGDHPETARAIATEVGLLLDDASVVVGADLPLDDGDLAEMVDRDGVVIARVDPEDKLRIARVLQERGHVVAMTGDGVNDAPALHEAAIGIAMGVGGTDVARDAADLVLLDDDFATIVRAIEQGRATFANIRRFLTYHLTANVAELTPFIVWALTSGRVPLALGVLQILAFDIGADVLPALALGVEPAGAHVLDHRPTRRHLLDRAVLVRAFGVLGPTEAVVSMIAFVVVLFAGGWRYGEDPTTAVALAASGAAFAAIVLGQAANAFACRSTVRPVWRIVPPVTRTIALAVAVQLALLVVFLLPPMAGVLGQARPTLLGLCIGLCGPPAIVAVDALHKGLHTWRTGR